MMDAGFSSNLEYYTNEYQEGIGKVRGSPEWIAGRFVPARHFDAIPNLPDWKSDWAPRFAAVFDVFGNAKSALKYSVNRYNRARTTGIAGNYNPLLSQTASIQWRDLNGDDIAQ